MSSEDNHFAREKSRTVDDMKGLKGAKGKDRLLLRIMKERLKDEEEDVKKRRLKCRRTKVKMKGAETKLDEKEKRLLLRTLM